MHLGAETDRESERGFVEGKCLVENACIEHFEFELLGSTCLLFKLVNKFKLKSH